MKIIHLALANLRKGKGAAFSLFALIIIAALLLNAGITIFAKMATFYDDKVQELQDPHVSMMMNRADYKPAYGDFFTNHSGVEEFEQESVILMNSAKFRFGDSDMNIASVILNADADRKFSPLKLVEKLDTINHVQSTDIFLPYSFKGSGGYELGDMFTITYLDKAYSYRIAGFFEATLLGANNMGAYKFLLPDTAYRELSGEMGGAAEGILVSAALKDLKQSTALLNDFNKEFPHLNTGMTSHFYYEADIETLKSFSTMTTNIVAMILVAFAAVIVLVSLIVIKYRVTNSVEDGIVNIGVLKALGYTSRQIIASMILQFSLITLFGGIAGVAGYYAFIPLFGGIISSLSGLLWPQSFDLGINLASVLVVNVLVMAAVLLSSLRIRKLLPVAALRGGLMTHNFKKNSFPLEKTKGGLQLALACKTIVTNRKQSVMIAFIIAAITFASVFSVVLYYNVATDKTAFVHLVGAETSNVMVQVKSEADGEALYADIKKMNGVAKASIMDMVSTKIDEQAVFSYISDDFGKMENRMVYKGRYPKYDNEIAVSWAVSKLIRKGIGDTVKVEMGEASRSFLITGISQSISNLGRAGYITLPGARQIVPDYKITLINVYLNPDTDNPDFMKNIKSQYGNMIEDITDIDEMIDSQSSVYIMAVFAVMVMILSITVLVVALILYLVIKTMILKRKKEFGILKSMGYTSFQLMTQTVLSFIPVVVTGVIAGGLLGCLYTNSMLTLLFSGAGIHNVQFTVKVPMILLLCIGLVAAAYLVSMLVASRIRRITAYGLITE